MKKIKFILENGIILIPGKVNDVLGYFIFDTGSMKTAINKAYFKLDGEEINVCKFVDSVVEDGASISKIQNILIDDLSFEDIDVLNIDLKYAEDVLRFFISDLVLLGTMGIELISSYNILIDYENQEMILNPIYVEEEYSKIDFNYDGIITINVTINNHDFIFMLDSGSNACLINQEIQELISDVLVHEENNIYTITSLEIGEHSFEDLISVICDIGTLKEKKEIDGVIGYEILKDNNIILDFQNKKLLIKK